MARGVVVGDPRAQGPMGPTAVPVLKMAYILVGLPRDVVYVCEGRVGLGRENRENSGCAL